MRRGAVRSPFRATGGGASLLRMAKLDSRAVQLLALVLGLTALAGFSQGLVHALEAPRPEQAAAGVDPRRDPVPNASAMTGATVLDEARVREIAREEAVAALGASARRKAAPVREAEEPDADDAAPATKSPEGASAPAATPAPQAAPAPSNPAAPQA